MNPYLRSTLTDPNTTYWYSTLILSQNWPEMETTKPTVTLEFIGPIAEAREGVTGDFVIVIDGNTTPLTIRIEKVLINQSGNL